jgi:predicted MFS family arabinose efflux permease
MWGPPWPPEGGSIPQLGGWPLIAVMCLGQVGNHLPHVALSALLAQHLMPVWKLNAAEGGLMASGYAFGYMLAAPVLTTLTDRTDARNVLLCGSVVSGPATIVFGIFAEGFWSGIAIWSLAGIGVRRRLHAGAEGPDRPIARGRHLAGGHPIRVEFSLGVGLSFLVAQVVADVWGWRWAFLITGVGPIAMVVACFLMASRPPEARSARLLDF